jgi:hypothetical protein
MHEKRSKDKYEDIEDAHEYAIPDNFTSRAFIEITQMDIINNAVEICHFLLRTGSS